MSIAQEHQTGYAETKLCRPDKALGDSLPGNRPLQLVDALCKALASEKINYCHWKSNAVLERSACGDNDLDLLVAQTDYQEFTNILIRLGFKEFRPPAFLEVPGIRNFYGYDPLADTFVHVHAHFQLILGHDFSKNYHIPIEQAYLISSSQGELFRVPAPEYELVIFVVRMLIKHFTWYTAISRQGRLSINEKYEFDYLFKQSSMPEVHRIIGKYLPAVDEHLFNDCIKVLQTDCPLKFKLKTGQGLMNKLSACARRPALIDLGLIYWRRLNLGIQIRLLHKQFRKQPVNGGIVVAIVGGDGAGKTTAINDLYQWLSPHFSVEKYHFGKPPWSWLTFLVRGALKIGTLMRISKFAESGYNYAPDPSRDHFQGYSQVLRALRTAEDRLTTYRKARRSASNGSIVLCDRFPLPQLMPMDGPWIGRILSIRPHDRLLKYFYYKEQDLYQKIQLPDVLIILRLDPEIAIQRKPEEASVTVYNRSLLIWELGEEKIGAIVIDASQSKGDIQAELKTIIWSRM
jgi:thymidylate kinase